MKFSEHFGLIRALMPLMGTPRCSRRPSGANAPHNVRTTVSLSESQDPKELQITTWSTLRTHFGLGKCANYKPIIAWASRFGMQEHPRAHLDLQEQVWSPKGSSIDHFY